MSSATAQVVPDLLKALEILFYKCQKVCSYQEDVKSYWKSEKRPHSSRWSRILLFTSLSKTLLTIERRLTEQYVILQQSKNKILSDEYWRVQLVYMKFQAHNSLEKPLEYNQDQMSLLNQVCYDCLTILGVAEILCSFRLVLEKKIAKRDTWVIKLKDFRKVFRKQFCFIAWRRQHIQTVE